MGVFKPLNPTVPTRVVFAGNELSVQESDTKVGGSHELGRGEQAAVGARGAEEHVEG